MYSWGDPYKGQLGFKMENGAGDGKWDHSVKGLYLEPKLVENTLLDGKHVVKVVCGGIHTSALTAEGELFTWGCGSDGRLGHPEYEGSNYLYKESAPKLVETFKGTKVVDIVSSYYHMCAIAHKL